MIYRHMVTHLCHDLGGIQIAGFLAWSIAGQEDVGVTPPSRYHESCPIEKGSFEEEIRAKRPNSRRTCKSLIRPMTKRDIENAPCTSAIVRRDASRDELHILERVSVERAHHTTEVERVIDSRTFEEVLVVV